MGPTEQLPELNTAESIARQLGVSVARVQHILSTRPYIQPAAIAGSTRVYRDSAVAMIRHELNAIDARRASSPRRNRQQEAGQ
jgi:hypothetical protein